MRTSVYYKDCGRLYVKTFPCAAMAAMFIKTNVTGFYKTITE